MRYTVPTEDDDDDDDEEEEEEEEEEKNRNESLVRAEIVRTSATIVMIT